MKAKTLKENVKNKIRHESKKILDKYIDFGIYLENKLYDYGLIDVFPEGDKLELDNIKDFIDVYLGMLIVNVKTFSEDLELEDSDELYNKIISDCKINNNSIDLELSALNGKRVGILKLKPTRHGSFAERSSTEIPGYISRYRINFYGGNSLEYIDSERLGEIEFLRG